MFELTVGSKQGYTWGPDDRGFELRCPGSSSRVEDPSSPIGCSTVFTTDTTEWPERLPLNMLRKRRASSRWSVCLQGRRNRPRMRIWLRSRSLASRLRSLLQFGVRDDKGGLVLREIHPPPQFLEAWLAAQGLERTKYPDPRHPAKAELETRFQPSQCLILFPQGCV